jgi:CheY-like chemotaxis protein
MRCDPAQMQQVLTNLVHNARDAMPGGGSVSLTARGVDDFVELIVADSGEGIREDVLPRVFEPLFTTKRTGTGLGLAVARQLVLQNGGSIHVESTPGSGTTFTICIPRTEEEDEAAENALPERSSIRRILIVDDESTITAGMTALLESEGFEVRSVDRGLAAAAAIEEFDPEAVILDLTLPDIEGTEVYRMLAERRPDLPVIFASGHMDEAFLRDSIGNHRVAFLRKPYDFETLLGALEEIS